MDGAASFWAVTAWAQLSGLEQLAPELKRLRRGGGSAAIVVGVDGGIATREALLRAAELFDPAWVFHDTGRRTFHPKLFCVERADRCLVSIGSSNLTGGGLFENYEANVAVTLDLGLADDRGFLAAVRAYRDALTAPTMPCVRLTPELVERLSAEEGLVAAQEQRDDAATAARAKAEAIARHVFGAPVKGLFGAPRSPGASAHGRRAGGRIGAAEVAELRWAKRLTASDVLRKPQTSHQRNYVALSQAEHDIDHTTWFRHELFGGLAWSRRPMRGGRRTKEIVVVPFEVMVGAERLGPRELIVDHAETRIARQRNAPTYLNWSSLLPLIRANDFRDWWLEIARFRGGRFRLSLRDQAPAGD